MIRGKVIIIPDEAKILKDVFEINIPKGINHVIGYQMFSEQFFLDYNFKQDDFQWAPLQIAAEGHLSIKTEEDISMLFFYIPELITERQMLYFENHMDFFSKYQLVGCYSVRKMDSNIFSDEILGLSEIQKEINKRYFKWIRNTNLHR